MIRVLPDSNVIISAVFWAGKPYKVVSRGLKGDYQLVTSLEIIREVSNKLRIKFLLPEEKIAELANVMLNLFRVVSVTTEVIAARDKSDDKIIECAIDGKADFIVTGDPDLLVLKEFKGIKIVSPKDFLETVK